MFAVFRTTTAVIGLAGLVACSAPTRCTVTNHSQATLTDIVVSGSTFSVSVPELAPGGFRVVALSPRGEEGTLTVAFRANGRDYRQSEPTYFEESGYEVRINVSPEFQVTSDVSLGPSGAPTPTRARAKSAS